jgi:hypothetical protein
MKRIFLNIAIIVMFAAGAQAQVTIGELKDPESFSILELVSTDRGLRLPQMTTAERETMQKTSEFKSKATTEAMGLQIFNTTTKCVETWNGVEWILACDCGDHPCPKPHDLDDIPAEQPEWSNNFKWVGAFWRDDQTGERIIASKVTDASVTWTASVDDKDNTGSWLTLDGNGGYDENLWKDNPDDAEAHQLPATRLTSVSGKGNILFRIGATSTNPQTDDSYDTKRKPRYAKVNLTVNDVSYTIFCRQGHSADSVFRRSDNATGGNMYNAERTLAAKFSPYNLTNTEISETVTAVATGVGTATDGSYKGDFVKYPTQAGAFFQWGMQDGNNVTFAYHPASSIVNWNSNHDDSRYWDQIQAAQETCPDNWRRPTVGDITTGHSSQLASDSELMQSLFEETFNQSGSNYNDDNHRYWGYYADGYFDRRAITYQFSNYKNTAVSPNSKDVAYIGLLYTNPATNASLFAPAGGSRNYRDGSLTNSGLVGYYWSSSSVDKTDVWGWSIFSSVAYQDDDDTRSTGSMVRCVRTINN